MPKSKIKKRDIIAVLKERIAKATSVVFVNFDKLTHKESEELRGLLRQEQSECYVAKKTLLDIAFKESGNQQIKAKELSGQIVSVFGYGDQVSPAKVINNFRKDKEEKLNFVGGILEGKSLTAAEVHGLALLPSKQELLAKLVGSLNAPVSGFVNALAGNIRNLVNVLKAIEEKNN